MFDNRMCYLEVSSRWLIDYRLEGMDLYGRSHYEIFPEIPERWKQMHQRGLAGEVLHADADRFLRTDGTVQWVRWEIRPWHTSNGEIGGIVLFTEDITTLKQAEETLRKYYTALQHSSQAIMITGASGEIEYINPGFTAITGYSADEAIGRNPKFLRGGTDKETYKGLWEALSNGRSWKGFLHNKRKDGSLLLEDATISPVRDESGAVTHYLAIKEDITVRRALEEQLLQSQKMDALGQLAGGIAHDLNNILQVITGHASLLQSIASPGQHEAIREIALASERAAELTSGLLSYSRKQMMKIKPTDLCQMLMEISNFLRRVLGEDIQLKVQPPSKPLMAAIDRTHIQQVFINLATNARDAMPCGGTLSISIDELSCVQEGECIGFSGCDLPHARIVVADTGTGISSENHDKIFEPFFTTKETGCGSGLGLAIVYGIIRQHNGYITIESDGASGARFNIYLPLCDDQAQQLENPHIVKIPARGRAGILVVEDEPSVRKVIKDILMASGYMVIDAASGMEALEIIAARKTEVDLVVVDAIMPGLNGAETLRKLRVIKPDLKALVMSGYAREIVSGKMIFPDDIEFLNKPVMPKDLIKKIASMF